MRPLCADIAGDAYLEIVVGDLAGVLAVLDYRGEEVWSRSLSGPLSLGLAIADVDGDGTLDVVAVTDNGDVWVLNGETGNEIPRFPIRTGSRMKSNPLIVDLSKEGDRVHIVLATGDGELLIVDGKTGCVRRIDISEEVYAKVVAMRDPDTDLIDLIVATMNGNVFQFSTGGKWVDGSGERNDGGNMEGIYVPHYLSMTLNTDTHGWFDVVGNRVDLPITIVDRRKNSYGRKYHVAVFRKGQVLVEEDFWEPGPKILRFESDAMGYYAVQVVLTSEHQQMLQLDVSIHANVRLLSIIKYGVLIPFLAIMGLLLLSSNLGTPLPL
ncbi:hypothetical protein WA538_004454 [Blastocystis sp. DL]